MKILSLALLLMAILALVLLGCSDNSAVPVSPTDQSVQAPASLGKSNNVTAPFFLNSLKNFVGGQVRYVGRNLQIKKYEVWEDFQTTETRVSGQVKHYLSLTVDVATGEGPCHGSFTINPTTGNGVWEGTYNGYRSKTDNPYLFSLPLKGVAIGKGGTIDKMQLFFTITLNVITTGDPAVAPPQVPIYWGGEGSLTVKEH
jgi:hypothetical protein